MNEWLLDLPVNSSVLTRVALSLRLQLLHHLPQVCRLILLVRHFSFSFTFIFSHIFVVVPIYDATCTKLNANAFDLKDISKLPKYKREPAENSLLLVAYTLTSFEKLGNDVLSPNISWVAVLGEPAA